MALEQEIATYRRKLPELLAHEGKFVVIHGEEVAGFCDSLSAALELGYERYLDKAFLAREVSKTEKVLTMRRLRSCP